MIIQLNAGKDLSIHEEFGGKLKDVIIDELHRFSDQITRVEVHLSDENGPKQGKNDKRCLLEARLEGLKPIAVTEHADNHEDAVNGALEKLKRSLETTLGKLKSH